MIFALADHLRRSTPIRISPNVDAVPPRTPPAAAGTKLFLRCHVHRTGPNNGAKPPTPMQEFPSEFPFFLANSEFLTGTVQEKEKTLEFFATDLFADLTWIVLTRLGYSDLECIPARGFVKVEKWNMFPVDFVCSNSHSTVMEVLGHLQSYVSIHVFVCSTVRHRNLVLSRCMKDKLLSMLLQRHPQLLNDFHCPSDVRGLLDNESRSTRYDEDLEMFNRWSFSIANSTRDDCNFSLYDDNNNNNNNNNNNIIIGSKHGDRSPGMSEKRENSTSGKEHKNKECLTIRQDHNVSSVAHEALEKGKRLASSPLEEDDDDHLAFRANDKRAGISGGAEPERNKIHENEASSVGLFSTSSSSSSKITWRPAFESLQKEKADKFQKDNFRKSTDGEHLLLNSSYQSGRGFYHGEREFRRSSDSEMMVDVDDLSDDAADESNFKSKLSKDQKCSREPEKDRVTVKSETWNNNGNNNNNNSDNLSQEIVAYSKRLPLHFADSNFLEKYPDSFGQNFIPDSGDSGKQHHGFPRGGFRETPPAFFSPPLFLKDFHDQSAYPSVDGSIRFQDDEDAKTSQKKSQQQQSKTYQTSHTETHFSVNYISKWQNRKQSAASDLDKKTGNGKSFRNSGSPDFESAQAYREDAETPDCRSVQRRYHHSKSSSNYDQVQFADQRRQHAMHSFQAAMSQAFNLHCLRHPAAIFYPHQPTGAHSSSSSAFDPAKMLAVAAAVVGGGGRSGNAQTMSPSGSQDGTGSSDGDRRKRSRVFIDPLTEIPRLERWFNDDTHPSAFMIEQFTEELNRSPYRQRFPSLEPKNVQLWFKNHRAKVKRQKLEMSCSASVGGSTTTSASSGGQVKPGMTF